MLDTQVQGPSSVGVINTKFVGNVNANSQGGAVAVAPGGLVQVQFPVTCLQVSLKAHTCFSESDQGISCAANMMPTATVDRLSAQSLLPTRPAGVKSQMH